MRVRSGVASWGGAPRQRRASPCWGDHLPNCRFYSEFLFRSARRPVYPSKYSHRLICRLGRRGCRPGRRGSSATGLSLALITLKFSCNMSAGSWCIQGTRRSHPGYAPCVGNDSVCASEALGLVVQATLVPRVGDRTCKANCESSYCKIKICISRSVRSSGVFGP